MHTRPWICNFGSCVVPGAGAQSTLASDACIGDRLRTFEASEAVVTCVHASCLHEDRAYSREAGRGARVRERASGLRLGDPGVCVRVATMRKPFSTAVLVSEFHY